MVDGFVFVGSNYRFDRVCCVSLIASCIGCGGDCVRADVDCRMRKDGD
jgi:hypothetical protein